MGDGSQCVGALGQALSPQPAAQRVPARAQVCALHLSVSAFQLDCVDPRAVQLGALLVRGLTMVVLVNSVCGWPLRVGDFMPWNVFDGKLFHEKYLQSEKGCAVEVLVEQNVSSLSVACSPHLGFEIWLEGSGKRRPACCLLVPGPGKEPCC